MIALIKTLQVVLALSLLIFIHELGHFAWARLFHIKVEKFFLFFDIGGKALARWRWGETEFGIGWLPLGGYCKIAGMIDESLDTEQLRREPLETDFRAHPAWHRLLVMAGGVLNNFLFAVIAYCFIAGIWGESFIPNDGSRIYVNELAYDMGFRTGDRILKLDDFVPEDFGSLQADMVRKDIRKASVLRGNDTLDIYIDHSMTGEMLNSPMMFDLAIPFVIDSIVPQSPNFGCGLQKGDRITSIEGTETEWLQDARKLFSAHRSGTVGVTVSRADTTLSIPVQVDSSGRIGVYMQMPEIRRRDYTFAQAVPAGFRLTGKMISGYLSDLRLLVTPSSGAYKSVGSFIAIGQVFPASWDWFQFMYVLALLSIMLGVMNLIPIPGLDGGHILFTLYEMITGRKPSDRFLYVAQLIGMFLLIALMMLAFGNDIGRLIH